MNGQYFFLIYAKKMDSNAISGKWFETPLTHLQRPKLFCQVIFNMHMQGMNWKDIKMGAFFMDTDGHKTGFHSLD